MVPEITALGYVTLVYRQRYRITQSLHRLTSYYDNKCESRMAMENIFKDESRSNTYKNNVEANWWFCLQDADWATFKKCRQGSENPVLCFDVSNGVLWYSIFILMDLSIDWLPFSSVERPDIIVKKPVPDIIGAGRENLKYLSLVSV